MTGIGIDTADIGRFRDMMESGKRQFMDNTFTPHEQEYCNSYSDPAPHFAGTFAAKEAVRKTSPEFHIAFSEIEIRRSKEGMPHVRIRGEQVPLLHISITHGLRDASAVAFKE